MNILGPITADFVQRMKANAPKGWVITPLVTNDYFVGHGGLLPVLPPPAGASPHDHFMQHMAQPSAPLKNGRPSLRECYVKVKIPGRSLRLVKLSPVPESHVTGGHSRKVQEKNEGKDVLYVSYWRANGWVRDQYNHQRFTGRYPPVGDDFPPPGHDTLLIHGIIRISKHNRKKCQYIDGKSKNVHDKEGCY